MRPGFWSGKRVLLTGHTGFKGSWMSLWLQQLGAELTGYSLAPDRAPNLFDLAGVGRGMNSVIGDVRDALLLHRTVAQCRPQIVIHMAAQALVQPSYVQPVETYAVNVMGTVNLLESVRVATGARAVVNVTSDKCYENREWLWPYRENEQLGGADPYSSSKACSEIVSAAYRASFYNMNQGPALGTARAGNVIGGGDWAADRLVPDLLAAFAAARPAELRHPNAIRPWQHVLEPLIGYLMLAERLHDDGNEFAQAWNFGPRQEDARTVEWVAHRLAHLWGDGAQYQASQDGRGHEAGCLKLDASMARTRLGWKPALALEEALGWVVDWSKRLLAGEDARKLTMDQIAMYQKRFSQTAGA